MKKVILILFVISGVNSFSQSKNELSKWLDDFAVCGCLSSYYTIHDIHTKDSSLSYYFESSLIDHTLLLNVLDEIEEYVKKIKLNSSWNRTTPAINYCLKIKEDKDFLNIKKQVLNGTLKVD